MTVYVIHLYTYLGLQILDAWWMICAFYNDITPKRLQDKSCEDLCLVVTASFLGNLCKLLNGLFTTISGHFSTNYMNIFHKTKVQTVILRCLMGLNLDWFRIYGL